jgi:SCY1-like protein 2
MQPSYAAFPPPPAAPALSPPLSQPNYSAFAQPVAPPAWSSQSGVPNYNISLTPSAPVAAPPPPFMAAQPMSMGQAPAFAQPAGMGAMLAPSKPATPAWGAGGKKVTKDDWGDFDPLA